MRNILQTIADPILDNLKQREHNAYVQLKMLENRVGKWDNEKKKIKKSSWWNDIAKGLAKQINTASKNSINNSSSSTHPLAALDPIGIVWHMNLIAIQMFSKNKCFCNKNLSVDDVKNIVKQLRLSDGLKDLKLFSKYNCKLPEKDKTYERFTQELNLMMKKYNINTCIRKIHFLTQLYVESDRFRTLEEYGTKNLKYNPWRGIIELTFSGAKKGEMGYKQYFKYIGKYDHTKDYERLNMDLHLAIDVRGYFGTRGKSISKPGDYLKSDTPLNGKYQYYKKNKNA